MTEFDPNDINEWPISARTFNALKKASIRSVEDIRSLGLRRFLLLPNCGRKAANELAPLIGGWPPPRREAFVIWGVYSDGTGAEPFRVYLDEVRAREDMALLSEGESARTFTLKIVPLGPR